MKSKIIELNNSHIQKLKNTAEDFAAKLISDINQHEISVEIFQDMTIQECENEILYKNMDGQKIICISHDDFFVEIYLATARIAEEPVSVIYNNIIMMRIDLSLIDDIKESVIKAITDFSV